MGGLRLSNFWKQMVSKLRNIQQMIRMLRDRLLEFGVQQKNLIATWTLLKNQGTILPLEKVGFKVFSQFEEDGLLLYLFTIVGTTNKIVVEICAGDGRECMASNLLIHHGWTGFLFDGDEENVRRGERYFATHPATFGCPPVFKKAWITTESVNSLLRECELHDDIDLLSIDIDGNDLWIWRAITQVSPRILIVETQNSIPADLSLSVPYDPNFYVRDKPLLDFSGASALAFVRVSRRKGYRLVGAHRFGFNLIFMRSDVGLTEFPEIDIASVHANTYTLEAQRTRWPLVKDRSWEQIE